MNKSSKVIVEQLLRYKKVSVETLSESLQKSTRTIYNYINIANDELVEYDIQIVSNYDKTYSLLVLDEKKLLNLRKDINESIDYNDQQERIDYLIDLLLLSNNHIKIDDLAEQLNISRSLIKKDLNKIREVFHEYKLEIKSKPHYGLITVGEEYNKRLCYSHFMKKKGVNNYIEKNNLKEIKDTIRNIVVSCLANADYSISDDSLNNLVMHIYISYKRIISDTYVHIDAEVLESQREYKEYQIANNIAILMNEILGVELDENECGYMTIHLRSKKNVTDNIDTITSDEQASSLNTKIIKEITKHSQYDFSKDLDFTIALYQHIVTLLVRLKYSNELKNPLLNEIKSKMIRSYDLATIASYIISQELNIKLSDDEIGYIAMHIECALEKRKGKTRRKILIVCSSGKGTANLLKLKYETTFKEYLSEIIVCGYLDFERYLNDSFDCIFTTIDLQTNINIPIIKVNNIIDDEEIKLSKQHMMNYHYVDTVKKYLKEDLLFSNLDLKTKKEVLDFMVLNFKKHYEIPTNFLDAVYKREEISSTEFDSIIAIPHPIYPITQKTFFSIAILKKPILWDSQYIRMVILLSCSNEEKDSDDLYDVILSLIRNKQAVQHFFKKPTYENLLNLVEGEICSKYY